MFDPKKPVRLRDGREAKIYAVYEDQNLIHGAYYSDKRKNWYAVCWEMDGSSTFLDESYGLVNIPEVKKCYRTVFANDYLVQISDCEHQTLEQALKYRGQDCVGIICISYSPESGLKVEVCK